MFPFHLLVIPSSLAQQSSCRHGTDHLGIIIALWRFRMASRSRASEYCSNALRIGRFVFRFYCVERPSLILKKKRDAHTIRLVSKFMNTTRDIFARKSVQKRQCDVEKCTRRRTAKSSGKEKAAIKLMNRTKKAGYLLKHTAAAGRRERGRFIRVKKLPARHRAISVARRGR